MSRRYSRGKRARAICDRGGHEIPYRNLVIEPGTGLRVDKRWSDGKWNLVDHPQNFSPRNLNDEAPLKYPTSENLPCTLDNLIDNDGLVLEDYDGFDLVINCESNDQQLILTDNNYIPLVDNSNNKISGTFGYKFSLSYGK